MVTKLKREHPHLKIYSAIDPYRTSIRKEYEYVQQKLDAGVDTDLTAHLGWRGRVERQISELQNMQQKGAVVARAILRSQLEAKYGVTIS